MRNRIFGGVSAAVIALALALTPRMLSQTPSQPGAAKAPNGAPTPDLTGVWVNVSKPGQTFNAKEHPSFQPWAEEKWKANRNPADLNGDGLWQMDPAVVSCFPTGMPRVMTSPTPFEIFQVPGRVLILIERGNELRQIYTDGRKHSEDPDPSYGGESVGWWEGVTLVVDTIGLNDRTWLDRTGHPHSDALHIVERFRRVSHDRLEVDFRFEDPKAFTKPWSGQLVYKFEPGWDIKEYVNCEDHMVRGEIWFSDRPRPAAGVGK